ncbi:unnamed protein product [Clonostachys byssicola]|uniref:Uncharacterized protein n=1 Tax=Clonostachys byssicola TaxID=160290 RepID=A0A9N9U1K6_9HYPO|nr:unnamed protein product [Clonostachys byssicola]
MSGVWWHRPGSILALQYENDCQQRWYLSKESSVKMPDVYPTKDGHIPFSDQSQLSSGFATGYPIEAALVLPSAH